jgi:hypothetical protein
MVSPSPNATLRFVPADFLTSSHYIFGQAKVASAGLLGVMSDPTTAFMEVHEASLARVQTADAVINYSPLMWIAKDRVVAVCLNKKEYVGPQPMLRGGYARVLQYSIQITTTVYELSGIVEWTGRFDFSAMMAEGTNAFIVLQDAVLVSTLFPKLRIEKPAMLFNRRYLDSLVVARREG